MTWKGQHPVAMRIDGDYPRGVIVPKNEMKELNKRLERSETLGKYDVLIRPLTHAAGNFFHAARLNTIVGR